MSGMGTYRINAKEDATIEDKHSFWKRSYKTAIMRSIIVAGGIVGGAGAYGIVYYIRSPAKPYQCRDYSDIRVVSQGLFECAPGQRLETTRRADGNVLMSCWCADHYNTAAPK